MYLEICLAICPVKIWIHTNMYFFSCLLCFVQNRIHSCKIKSPLCIIEGYRPEMFQRIQHRVLLKWHQRETPNSISGRSLGGLWRELWRLSQLWALQGGGPRATATGQINLSGFGLLRQTCHGLGPYPSTLQTYNWIADGTRKSDIEKPHIGNKMPGHIMHNKTLPFQTQIYG